MENSTILVATSTKAIFSMINEKGTEKFFGLMAASTRVNGEMGFKMGKDKYT